MKIYNLIGISKRKPLFIKAFESINDAELFIGATIHKYNYEFEIREIEVEIFDPEKYKKINMSIFYPRDSKGRFIKRM